MHPPRAQNYTAVQVACAIDWERWSARAALACAVLAACSGRKSYEDVYVQGGGAGQPTAGGEAATAGASAGAGAAAAEVGGAGSEAAGAAAGGPMGGGESGVDGDLLYIKASNPDAQDEFGNSVALSGDWLAVGAPNESSNALGVGGDQTDDSGDSSGAVYLFSREDSGWAQRVYVKASNAGPVDGFGSELAFSKGTLAVSAPFEDSAATGIDGAQTNGPGGNQGAVYVFVQVDGEWQQQAYVKATNTGAVDLFGRGVALDGDLLIVGAPGEDSAATSVDGDQSSNAASSSGAAYVYERTSAKWQPLSYLKASNAEAEDEFGHAVAISGTALAVGAPGESSSDTSATNPDDNAAHEAGAVYVFERAGTSYEQVAYLKASNANAEDRFGEYLALEGDTLVVSAVGESTFGGDGTESNELRPQSGAVYVFERAGGAWSQTAYLKAPVIRETAYFGTALGLAGDTLVVGALGDDSGDLPLSGAAYVYARTAQGWELSEAMKAANAEAGDRFGGGVTISPTLLAIGAHNEAANVAGINGDWTNNDTPGAGAVYLYRR